jgi:CubicO group peptidase (beta-lactamase class C family)
MQATPVDALYREKGIDFQAGEGTLAQIVDKAAALPLIAQPGTRWNYSISTDVVGRLVEVISGQPFERFMAERILAPLGMRDTAFHVPADKVERFAACYVRGPDDRPALMDDPLKSRFLAAPQAPSGGGGLVSTTADYLQFCRLMLGKGALGELRLIGRKTAQYMTMNHLPGDLASMGTPRFAETPYTGVGFGLGFSVVIDPAKSCTLSSTGEYAWGGMASTGFWCDPVEDLAVIVMTQLVPSSAWPIRRELRVLVNQAIVD